MLRIQPFTITDLGLLAALSLGLPANQEPDADTLARTDRWSKQPNLNPPNDCLIAFRDDLPIGYVYLTNEIAIRRGVLTMAAPRATLEESKSLLDAAVDLANKSGISYLDVDVPSQDEPNLIVLIERGFERVRTHLHLIRSSNSPTARPSHRNIRIAQLADVPTITTLQNAAFEGSWGFNPNTPEEIEYRIFTQPDDPPDIVLILENDIGAVAYCWTHVDPQQSGGLIGMVGVQPTVQGQGFGKDVTAAGVDHLVNTGATPISITVDSENAPAVNLYRSLGFDLATKSLWYRLNLL